MIFVIGMGVLCLQRVVRHRYPTLLGKVPVTLMPSQPVQAPVKERAAHGAAAGQRYDARHSQLTTQRSEIIGPVSEQRMLYVS